MEAIEFLAIITVYILLKECSYWSKIRAMKQRYLMHLNVAKFISAQAKKDRKSKALYLLSEAVRRPHLKYVQHFLAFIMCLVLVNFWFCICVCWWETSQNIQNFTLGVAMISNLQFLMVIMRSRFSREQYKALLDDSKA